MQLQWCLKSTGRQRNTAEAPATGPTSESTQAGMRQLRQPWMVHYSY